MKKILLISLLLLYSVGVNAQSEYISLWNKADSLIELKYYKSGLQVVDKIYNKSRDEKNAGNMIRALIYSMQLKIEDEEELMISMIEKLNNEILISDFPVKNVLYSLLASSYHKYFKNFKYKITNRGNLQDTSNVKFWGKQKLFNEIYRNFDLSLEFPDSLNSIDLSFLEASFYKRDSNQIDYSHLTPTLFSFLAFRAIDFYNKYEISGLYDFDIDDNILSLSNRSELFLPAEDFINLDFKTDNKLNSIVKCLETFRDLTKYNLLEGNKDVLINIELGRLDFVYRFSELVDKNELYTHALNILYKKYSDIPYSITTLSVLALFYYEHGDVNGKKLAADICTDVINKYPDNPLNINCKNLIKKIRKDEFLKINFLSAINLPDKPFLGLIEYQNISSVKFRIYKTNINEIENLKSYKGLSNLTFKELIVTYFFNKTPEHTSDIFLPEENNFDSHSAEIIFPPLPAGEYIIIGSTSDNLKEEGALFAYDYFLLSNIGLRQRVDENGVKNYLVFNSESGEPLDSVFVKIFLKEEFSNDNCEVFLRRELITDSTGQFNIEPDISSKYHNVEMVKGNSYLNISNLFNEFQSFSDVECDGSNFEKEYFYNNQYKYKENFNIQLFTDRKIYRPGQTIYFKGILSKKNNKVESIASGVTCKVVLHNYPYFPQSREISSLNLISNEFGSISGCFKIPLSGVIGNLKIICYGTNNDEIGNININVEEYRKPTFDINFEESKAVFSPGDTVKIKGKAINYSGSGLDSVKVKYVIEYNSYKSDYFNSNYFYKGYNSKILIPGEEVFTKSDGSFEIIFNSLQLKNNQKGTLFIYKISAEITDKNGETRANYTYLRIKSSAISIILNTPENIIKDKPHCIGVKLLNSNEKTTSSKVNIKIERLKDDGKIYSRVIEHDRFLYTEKEFNKYFPDERYYKKINDDGKTNSSIYENNLFLCDTILFIEKLSKEKQGKYKITVKAKDKFGEEYIQYEYFNLIDPYSPELFERNLLWIYYDDRSYKPGELVEISVGTSFDEVKVFYEIGKNKTITHSEWLTFNKSGKRIIKIPVEKNDIDGFTVHFFSIKDNKFKIYKKFINVQNENNLKIDIKDFSDKLKPGVEKEITLTVNDVDNSIINAELLLSMYDTALDFFVDNKWKLKTELSSYYKNSISDNFPTIYPTRFITLKNNLTLDIAPKLFSLNFILFDEEIGSSKSGNFNLFGNNVTIHAIRKGIDVEQSGRVINSEVLNLRGGRTNEEIIIVNGVETTNPLDNENNPQIVLNNYSLAIPVRKNFDETAFFIPDLKIIKNNIVTFKFKIPETLTRWKLQGFVHTKDMKTGYIEKDLITQKELMIFPNVPRFLKENDTAFLNVKISNISGKSITGNSKLLLFNKENMNSIDSISGNINNTREFILNSGSSITFSFKVYIPNGLNMITYRFIAGNKDNSDGEENSLPVLSDNVLVTESYPFVCKDNCSENIFIKNLTENKSESLKSHSLTFEITSNPVWNVIQSIPYLFEYPYECSEQNFSKLFANGVSLYLLNNNPQIRNELENWNNSFHDSLSSNLEKNLELKSILTEETPWILDSKNESERKKRLASLFDENTLSVNIYSQIDKLKKMQNKDGGFPWFENMKSDRYITQYILTGLGKMLNLDIREIKDNSDIKDICINAYKYCNDEFNSELRKNYTDGKLGFDKNRVDNLNFLQVQYLFMREYFKDIIINDSIQYNIFFELAKKLWQTKNIHIQAMISMILYRNGYTDDAKSIIASIKDRAFIEKNSGMYFPKDYEMFSNSQKIEIQSLIIESFNEITSDTESIGLMRLWLLNLKRINNWETTIATVSACFALLDKSSDLLDSHPEFEIKSGSFSLNNKLISDSTKESGTRYFKTVLKDSEVDKDFGTISVTQKGNGISWGAVHWQYFEKSSKVQSHGNELSITKKITKKMNSQDGEILIPINETEVKVGDEIVIILEITSDKDYEYIHIKDYRASGLEPLDIFSKYEYKNGLWYYITTRDVSTNYFISDLKKGAYVLEHRTKAFNQGTYSAGIATIQCMYAPEFNATSDGQTIIIK